MPNAAEQSAQAELWLSPLFAGAVVVPLVLLAMTIVARSTRKMPFTSGADLVALLLGFDAGVLLAPAEFRNWAANEALADSLHTVHVVLVFIGFLWWYIAVHKVEPRLASFYSARGEARKRLAPYYFAVGSWAFGYAIAVAHLFAFIGLPFVQ